MKTKSTKTFLLVSCLALSLIKAQNYSSKYFPTNEQATTETKVSDGKLQGTTTCMDKNNYVGNVTGYAFQLGGKNALDPFTKFYQVFPSYSGSVIGVEFQAAKYNNASPNYTLSVSIHGLNFPNVPASIISGSVNVVVTSTANTTYSVAFPGFINVPGPSGGFAVAISRNSSNQDSVKLFSSPQLTPTISKSYFNTTFINTVSILNYLNFDVNFLFRPLYLVPITNNLSTSFLSPACQVPANVGFVGSHFLPSYIGDSYINPNGISHAINFGDASPVATTSNPTHVYNNSGVYNTTYSLTYNGWNNNCVVTQPKSVVVSSTVNSLFSYTANNFTHTFTNLSANGTGYSWNFGDLSTSTLQNPPPHVYAGPGTYIVELDVTGPCGGPAHSQQTVTIAANTGFKEQSNINHLISLFPNPTNDYIHINPHQLKLTDDVYIYSASGMLIKDISNINLENNTFVLNISDINSGLYFIRLTTEKGVAIKTFIKK